ncbi:TAXI family TRAP transporter solute-binding subunit [Thioalkalivibrio sp.]|uniref:TAXI family TRAP transporter solute-binding subunit n=1 Tax=Thioalkalivibrio sp. TaxID=2093813 RepID=UPI003977029E
MTDIHEGAGRRTLPGSQMTGLLIWGLVALIGVVALAVAWQFVEPAPPTQVRLATGAPGGAYERVGSRYRSWFAEKGMGLEPVVTAGSMENWDLVLAGEVDAALVQGGTAPPEAGVQLEAVASIAFEPLFLFYRRDRTGAAGGDGAVDRLEALAGMRIAIGAEGSGTRSLVKTLVAEIGLDERLADTGTELLSLGGAAAVEALRAGTIDAAAFVMAPEAPLVRQLLASEGVGLVDLSQARSFARRLPYLSFVTLYEGVADPGLNLPPDDLRMVAPATYIVVRRDTHRSVVQLLIEAAQRDQTIHLVGTGTEFPSLDYTDIPVGEDARYFFERGPNWLHRHLPFWAASLLDRVAILIIPLLTVIIPLFRIAPAALQWSVRRRIFRWYRQIRVIDEEIVQRRVPRARLEGDLALLERLDQDVSATEVPLSYMEEFYNLRLHIAYMRQRVKDALAEAE